MSIDYKALIPVVPLAAEQAGQRWCWLMTNPSANQNRPPSPDPYRYFVCVSSVWLVLRAMEVAHTDTAVPVLPEAILDKESPAGEWAPIPLQAVLSAPTTPAMPFARST